MPLGKSRDQDLYKAAKSGDVAAIDRLLGSRKRGKGSVRKGPKGPNPNVQDSCGMTPLHYAALNGHSDVAQLLLLSGASAHVADHSGSYPIHLAAWKGDSEVAKTLVERGPSRADVNARSDCQETALHLSAQYGNTDVVEYLLEKRADPRLQNNKGETPLELAALFGHVDVVRSITRCHPDLLQQNFVKTSPLHLAARNGHVSVIASLITAGMDVNTLCDSGSVLHEAALFGKTEVVQFLTTKGIDASLVDKDGKTAVDVLDLYPSHRTEKMKNIISSSISSDTLEPSTQGKGSGFPDNSATMSGVANPVYDNVVRVGDSFVPNGAPHEGEPTKATMYYAVARVDYEDISNPSVLPLRTGGRVQVIGSNTNGAWVGVADGRKGTFFASHVDFYQTMVDGVKKISSEDIDKALLYLVSSSNGQGSPPTTWKRFSDSQILSDTSPPFQDVAAARSNSTYAQLHPVLEDTHTTQQTTQNSHYLNASTATKATFTMATTPTADYEHAKMSLQEAIKDGHVGSHLPPTQEVGPNQYLNLSMGAHSYLNFEEAQRRSSEYITPPKMIHTEKNRKDLHRLPHERQLSKDEIAFMSDSWSENKFDRIARDDRSLVHQTRPRIVSLGDLESDLQREAHSTVDEELEEGIFLRKEITTPEMGNVLRGRNPFLGGGARGSRKYRSALLFGKPNNFVPEQPLSPSSPPTPPTPPRVSREQLQLSDDVPLSISFDPHPPRCYEWSKPRSFGEGQTSHHIEDMPQVSVSAPTQPTPQVYDNVVLKPKPRKKTSILHSHSESAAHPNPVDVQRMELGKMNYENIGVILQKQQIQGTSPPNVTGISPIKDNTSVLTPPIPAPRTRPVSCVQPPTYENVVFKKQSSTVPEGVVICDNGNVYAGLILASKSFSTTKDRSRLHSFWTQHKDQEAWVQV